MAAKTNTYAPLKDSVILFLSNIVVEALSVWLIAPLIVYVMVNGCLQGFGIDVAIDWYMNKAKYWGYVTIISSIIIILFRYLTVGYYIRKYKAYIKLDLEHAKRIIPIIVIVVILEIIIYPLLINESYTPQALAEYNYYVELGVGFYGYLLELVYYVLEGLMLAIILYMGSHINQWSGLAILLILWTPIHILHGSGIDIINFVWAVTTALVLEFTRRRVDNNLLSILLVWMMIVLV